MLAQRLTAEGRAASSLAESGENAIRAKLRSTLLFEDAGADPWDISRTQLFPTHTTPRSFGSKTRLERPIQTVATQHATRRQERHPERNRQVSKDKTLFRHKSATTWLRPRCSTVPRASKGLETLGAQVDKQLPTIGFHHGNTPNIGCVCDDDCVVMLCFAFFALRRHEAPVWNRRLLTRDHQRTSGRKALAVQVQVWNCAQSFDTSKPHTAALRQQSIPPTCSSVRWPAYQRRRSLLAAANPKQGLIANVICDAVPSAGPCGSMRALLLKG